jgi:phosphate transport system substrate-binding protein
VPFNRRTVPIAVLLFGAAVLTAGCDETVPTPDDPSLAAPMTADHGGTRPAVVAVDPELPEYRAVAGVSGSLKSVGSDTMSNLMSLWAEGFKRFYPNVKIEIEGKGSSTAPPALIAGTADFGPMSRDLKAQEIDEFQAKFGYAPTSLGAAIDMVAVYVHKDNPLATLTMPQLDAIYSKTRKLGSDRELRTWGDLDLPPPWDKLPISLYGRNAASGTYGYFKEHALGSGDFKDSVKEQPGSSSVVQGVASERSAVGYSGIGYKTADVRAVPLAEATGEPAVVPEPANAYSGEYPLARSLWLTVNYRPGTEMDPVRREFIKYVFSKQGQTDVIKDGYLPVSAETAATVLESIGIRPASE